MVGHATGGGLVVVAMAANGVRVELLDTDTAVRQVAGDIIATLDAIETTR